MKYKLKNGQTIHAIGDPHLGRRFITNVPLAARGVKEQQLKDAYIENLNVEADFIVMMGDLFDKFDVPNDVILFAFQELEKASHANFKTTYLFNMGNHDGSRDTSKKSSYEVFAELVEKAELANVTVVTDECVMFRGIGAVPWHPFKTPTEMVKELKELADEYPNIPLEYVLTHNDVSTYGSDADPHNLMAFQALAELDAVILNGHVHQPSDKMYDGMRVVNIGAMLPLTFNEDSTGEHYVTLTLKEFEELSDYDSLKNKSVRIVLKPDEEAPDQIECLQFKVKRVNSDGEDDVEQVEAEDFELKTLYDTAMADVGTELKDDIWVNL